MSCDILPILEGEGHHRLVGMGGACISNLFGGDTRYTNKGGQVSLEIYYTLFIRITLIQD